VIFEPYSIKQVTFPNRILRSSVGGRTAGYDGVVGSTWKNFEKRFADGGVGGIISTTFNVNRFRKSPLEYPPISEEIYVAPLRKAIAEIRSTGCRYIIQLGDPGYAAQVSLFPEPQDSHSSSAGFDLIYGYTDRRTAMSEEDIWQAVRDFGDAAERVQATGADGVEVTASKGYLIHQFLNPGFNRRRDAWGGSVERRFRFLDEVVREVRGRVGPDYLFGIRLAAEDYNWLPINLRLPFVFPPRHYFQGNRLKETLAYGRRLKVLGVDYLNIDSGFGFIHPRVTPGPFPVEEARIFYDTARHLGRKASWRAALLHALPIPVSRSLLGVGWKYQEAINLDYAAVFRQQVGLPVIANGGFQRRETIEGALRDGKCDLVAMARALIANPDLVRAFEAGLSEPEVPCTFCNRCAARTASSPLGCYEPARFPSSAAMQEQILAWNRGDD